MVLRRKRAAVARMRGYAVDGAGGMRAPGIVIQFRLDAALRGPFEMERPGN
jgi:hypothetical protein